MTRRGLGPARKKDVKGESRRQIARPRSIEGASLEEEALRDALLFRLASRPAYYDGSSVPANMRTFPDEIFLKREHLGPGLVESGNIQSVAKGKVEGAGRWGPREISVPGLTDNPDSDAGRAVDAKSFADRNKDVNDALANRATNAEVKNALDVAQARTTVGQVDARIRKLVKKNSLNRG